MNRITKQVWCAACLGLWAQAAVTGLMADSLVPPGVPEPGLVIWGTVASASNLSTLVAIDSMTWEVTSTSGEHAVFSGEPYVQIRADQKGYYVLEIPFDTRTFNNVSLFEAPKNSFELKDSSSTYTLVPTVNGASATVVKVDGIARNSESFAANLTVAEKGKMIRLDLTVPIDHYSIWINGYFPGITDPDKIGKDADPDGDGFTNYEEFLAKTDPTDPDDYPGKRYHSADQDKDGIISLKELTRVIQFYNSKNEGGYHTEDGTEDGFAPGGGVTTKYHDSDYDPRNGMIELKELTRLIQFYNSKNEGGYHAETETEDGFAPGRAAAKGVVSLASDTEDALEEDSLESAREFSLVQYPDGLKLQIDVYINGKVDIRSLSLLEQLPDGWSFVELTDGDPAGYPEEGDNGLLEFYWIKMPKLPCKISYVLDTPVKVKGLQSLNGKVQWRTSGEEMDSEIANRIVIEEGMINYIMLADGNLGLFFNGKLYESEDLIQWDLIEEAINPYAVKVKDGQRFYRSKED